MRTKPFLFALLLVALAACEQAPKRNPAAGGDPQKGAAAIFRYGCGSCHTIAKLRYAHGLVGPPLTNMNSRMYVAGLLPNTITNIEHWIQNPQGLKPGTAMPNLGVTPQDAADIAAYLYGY